MRSKLCYASCRSRGVEEVIVRHADLGQRGPRERRYCENALNENLLAQLARAGVEALVEKAQGRTYVSAGDAERALRVATKVFGVSSASVAEATGSAMEEMQAAAARMSVSALGEGQSFAVKAKREGDHPYKSADIGREVGSAIFLANESRRVRVDLTKPDVVFNVEVRGRKARISCRSLPGPGGLPVGTQGRVLAVVRDDRDALAAWMMMRRGCRAIAMADDADGPARLLEPWSPNHKVVSGKSVERAMRDSRASAVVVGAGLNDAMPDFGPDAAVLAPLVGLSDEEIERGVRTLRDALRPDAISSRTEKT